MVGRARLLTVLVVAMAVGPHTVWAWAGSTTFGGRISANQVETDTPTPTPTETVTETPTPTLTGTAVPTVSATPQFYVIVTLQSGQEAAFKYEITAGDAAIFAELAILIALMIFGLFLVMRNVNR